MRLLACLAMALALMNDAAFAQAPPKGPVSAATTPPEADDEAWAFSASAYTYVVPDDPAYVQPTVTADRGRLHLEARYNYESFDTGSAWIGCNFSVGEKLSLEFTPNSPTQFASVIKDEIERYAKMVKQSGAKAD